MQVSNYHNIQEGLLNALQYIKNYTNKKKVCKFVAIRRSFPQKTNRPFFGGGAPFSWIFYPTYFLTKTLVLYKFELC